MADNVSLLFAFGAGLSSFLLPCVIPLVPVYFASLYGPEIFDAGTRKRFPIFLHSVCFVLGFTLIFSGVGAGAGLLGVVLSPSSSLVRWTAGSLLILFGIIMLAALKVPWLNFEKRLAPSKSIATGYLRSFLTGAVFSVAWTPCVGPVQGTVLTVAWTSQSAWEGAYLLAVYSLGLGLPFLVVGIAFDFVAPLVKKINRYSRVIYMVSGSLLVIMGVLVLGNWLVWY
ncbi:MAG TPA: cytochrome c biogenesis protein CcdA [Dehalococcoidales bacterium]|nr:cytochrome c biogenesis protein CcdA [Dehalococcoidales bacterium]